MSEAKEIFQRDKELSGRWSGWINGPDADRVFVVADALLVNHREAQTPGVLMGARIYKEILKSLCEPDEEDAPILNSGLNHDIDPKPRTKESLQKKKAK
jgi:hypothetical protein